MKGMSLSSFKTEARINLGLMLPLALTQLASAALGITSILLMGWSGSQSLAAGTLAVHYYTFFSVFTGGLLTAASPLMAHAFGASSPERAKQIAGQSLKIAIVVALVGTLITWHTGNFLTWMGQSSELVALAEPFARANSLSFVPAILLLIFRNYAAAAGHPRLGLMTILVGIVVNAVVGYGLMFGKFGLPEFGLVGLGLTSATVNILMFLIIFFMVQSIPTLRLGLVHLSGGAYIKPMLRIGWPIGLSGLGSVGTFVAVTFVIAIMGSEQVVGHSIALQAANVGFAILWGGAQATTIRIGWATGARNQMATEVATWTGMFTGIATAFILAAIFLIFRHQIAGFFLDASLEENQSSIEAAVTVLLAVSIYQLANGPQLVTTSALRGLRDTTIPFLISLFGYWVLGGIFAGGLGFVAGLQAAGIWLGLSAAISISGGILIYRLYILLPRALELTSD
jgi:MATE family multidrug resistance protein